MNIATCAKTSLKAVVSVPVGIRLQELPSMVKSLCAGIAGNADCSGGELTLTLEGWTKPAGSSSASITAAHAPSPTS